LAGRAARSWPELSGPRHPPAGAGRHAPTTLRGRPYGGCWRTTQPVRATAAQSKMAPRRNARGTRSKRYGHAPTPFVPLGSDAPRGSSNVARR
jgi:hypothetical protein